MASHVPTELHQQTAIATASTRASRTRNARRSRCIWTVRQDVSFCPDPVPSGLQPMETSLACATPTATEAPMQIIHTTEGQLYYQYRVATPVVQINDANIVEKIRVEVSYGARWQGWCISTVQKE